MRLYDRTQASQTFQSAFAQDGIRLLDSRFQLLVSGRFTSTGLQQPSFAGGVSPYAGIPLPSARNEYTGDVSATYFFARTGTKLRAHTGNSFRMPSIYERFGTFFFGGSFFPPR